MLQSIASPVIDHTVVKQRTTKKGNVVTTTTRYALTGSQLAFLAIIWGLVNLRTVMGAGGDVGSGAAAALGGAGSALETISTYGLGFMNKWRGLAHNARNTWREEHGKASTWMPPGYPAFWN